MKKLKHTPGPWEQSHFIDHPKYKHMDKKWKDDNENEEQRRVYANGIFICRCQSHLLLENDHANARLIAAVPEMLEALIEVLKTYNETLDAEFNQSIFDQSETECKKAIKVIEKATGLSITEILEEN